MLILIYLNIINLGVAITIAKKTWTNLVLVFVYFFLNLK